MKCPATTCNFECADSKEFLDHIKTHESYMVKNEYGCRAEIYTNSKGLAQINVSAKADTIDETVEKTFALYEAMKKKAEEEGITLV